MFSLLHCRIAHWAKICNKLHKEAVLSLRHVILAALSTEALTGYDITKRFDEVLGYFWRASHQQVYRELKGLVDEGLARFRTVPQQGKPDKKLYAITAKGKRELLRWLEAPAELPQQRDPLLVKLYAGEVAGKTALLGQLAEARKLHQEKLDTYRAIEREHYGDGIEGMPDFLKLIYLTLQHGIERERAWLRWSKDAAKVISSLRLKDD